MKTWIALLRGINVGGHHRLAMKDLVSEMESLGLRDVRTYIQSGNAVFRSKETEASRLSDRIAGAIESSHGFRPRVLVVSLETVRAALKASPFQPADAGAKTVHLFFLTEPAKHPDRRALDAAKADTEAYALTERVFYLQAPDGIGRSRLAEKAERLLGVQATARNWRSVRKILEMGEEIDRP